MVRTSDAAIPTESVTALSPLRFPVFRAVWGANILSSFGGQIQSVAAAWLMTSIAQSADMVALVQASTTLPIMVLALLAGAMADSYDRRKVMLASQVFLLVVSVTLTAVAWAGVITPWLLLLFTFLIGCGTAFNAPAWQASVADMAPREQLPGAVALNSMGFNIARSIGPAIGGAIVAAVGAAIAFAVNALSYIGLIAVLARWRPQRPPQTLPRETLGIAIGAGVRYVSMSSAIRTVLARSLVFGVGASALLALLPLVARDLVSGGALTYGSLLGSFGVGAVVGALLSARFRSGLSTEGLVRWASVAFAVAAAVVGLSAHLALTMAAMLTAGAAWVLALSTFNVSVQLSAPRWVVARALSLYQMAAFGGMAAGSWLWGEIADDQSVAAALLGAAAVMLISAALGRWAPLAQTERLNLDPLKRWKEPETAVPVGPRTGPVVVTIEYNIREEDIPKFFEAMAERRRIRIRDGARGWTLLRDLGDPQVWIERYSTPTWLDYMRHNSRLTQDDASVPERLRALHQGPGRPIVRRMIERQTGSHPAGHVAGGHDVDERLGDPRV